MMELKVAQKLEEMLSLVFRRESGQLGAPTIQMPAYARLYRKTARLLLAAWVVGLPSAGAVIAAWPG